MAKIAWVPLLSDSIRRLQRRSIDCLIHGTIFVTSFGIRTLFLRPRAGRLEEPKRSGASMTSVESELLRRPWHSLVPH